MLQLVQLVSHSLSIHNSPRPCSITCMLFKYCMLHSCVNTTLLCITCDAGACIHVGTGASRRSWWPRLWSLLWPFGSGAQGVPHTTWWFNPPLCLTQLFPGVAWLGVHTGTAIASPFDDARALSVPRTLACASRRCKLCLQLALT
jgi:hypothetical protein